MPWLTHPFLAWAKSQDWSDKTIVMFGAGLGDAWLAKRCKKLIVIERNEEWLTKAQRYSDANMGMVEYIYKPCNDSDGKAEYYLDIEGLCPDIIINDDAYRTECCQMAVDYFKEKGGGIFICDNYDQDYVWDSPKALEILSPFDKDIYPQPGHTDHSGKCWKTATIFIK